ncbi:hypothetical protein PISMIDRAFT_689281 [Pisolithus microcarpus 441]|uniref:Unplaced genomic scaffold scaffold_377, whole genome shotgun sequence n=1 Tax=Pisolithus microcarpus 441 TaxID=765257 RepID=A0A0C9YXJ1_9AGAM|nr:hypothetical protein PISMIDRAFT_689281 [Pisolithus microcarpus 441]
MCPFDTTPSTPIPSKLLRQWRLLVIVALAVYSRMVKDTSVREACPIFVTFDHTCCGP